MEREEEIEGRRKSVKEELLVKVMDQMTDLQTQIRATQEGYMREKQEHENALAAAPAAAMAFKRATASVFQNSMAMKVFKSPPTPSLPVSSAGPRLASTPLPDQGVGVDEKARLLIAGRRIIQTEKDAKVGAVCTPDWQHFSGSSKSFRVFLEELYTYLLKPEFLESEIVIELLADMTISLMQDDPALQARYSAFIQRVFSVKASIQNGKQSLSRKGF